MERALTHGHLVRGDAEISMGGREILVGGTLTLDGEDTTVKQLNFGQHSLNLDSSPCGWFWVLVFMFFEGVVGNYR